MDFSVLTSRDWEPAFWTPERLGRHSAWWGHVPFAFWLVANTGPQLLVELGTHNGVSYAAFCEAVLRRGLTTRCYAVDTWLGDPHAGAYEEDIYTDLKNFHDRRYGSFSKLICTTFDKACNDFADGSIDLLHIDGYHTYDVVRHDFDTWRPKLSDRAIVLFHDTNERTRDFGVWRLLDDLKREIPVFEFLHAHGLGVAVVGPQAPEAVKWLCGLSNEDEIASVRKWFSFFGDRWSLEQERTCLAAHDRAGAQAVALRDSEIAQRNSEIAQKDSEIAQKDSQLVSLSQSMVELRTDLHEAERQKSVLIVRLEQEHENWIRRLAGLTRHGPSRRLPSYLTGLRWLPPGRRKNWKRLVAGYRLIAASPLFDREWYLRRYPDIAEAEDAALHYLLHGGREGRSPGPDFNASGYLTANPDVAALGLNPLLHYLQDGHREDRPFTSERSALVSSSRQNQDPEELPPQVVQSLETLTIPLEYAKALYLRRCRLSAFRARTEGPLRFPFYEQPFFSVIICAFNKFDYNIRTLELLERAVSYAKATKEIGVEVVFVDDGSSDETAHLEKYVTGAVIKRAKPNKGFLRACNLGAKQAAGEFLVFLNNDVEFDADIFARLHDAVEHDKADVACFGGQILQFDGLIQDLGSGIWRDGVARGYFRNESPTRYAYAYPRDVDYVAGCLFCISAAEFAEFGGFDEVFSPGYYEETDLSMRLWETGRRSRVYPDIRLYHLEYGSFSSEASQASAELMARNRPIFVERHRAELDKRPEFSISSVYPTRLADIRLRILFIEDRVPAQKLGRGYGRSELIIRALLKKADVDIFAGSSYSDDVLPNGFDYLDIVYGPEPGILQQRLRSRHYDVVYVCRPHNIARYESVLRNWKTGGGSIIYDAEAIFTARDVAKAEGAEDYGAITSSPTFASVIQKELQPIEIADTIIAVNESEAGILRQHLMGSVLIVGHHFPARPLTQGPTARTGLLFVGTLTEHESPNYDSLIWFLDFVWPRIRAECPDASLRIVGFIGHHVSLAPLRRDGVTIVGPVHDLTSEYGDARVFIAPTRFSAGIPFKVHEAFSFGLPVVASRLVSAQVAHQGNFGGLLPATVRDSGAEFADACLRLLRDDGLWLAKREDGLAYIDTLCAPDALDSKIARMLEKTPARVAEEPVRSYSDWIRRFDALTARDRNMISKRISVFSYAPLISIVVPTYNTPESWLRGCIESVRGQLYSNWQLCVADDASTDPRVAQICAEYASIDNRIVFSQRGFNGHIAAATNTALSLARGEFVCFLDHDDELAPHALYTVAEALEENSALDMIYSDEDKIDGLGNRYEPWFKSDWNYDLMLSQNVVVHLGVYRRSLLQAIGGCREGFDGSQDYDMTLRFIERTSADRIRHLPFVLYHWRAIPGSVALATDQKEYAYEAARRAIQDHLNRTGTKAIVDREEHRGYYRVRWPLPATHPKVTVIIPTRDKVNLLSVCVESLLERTTYSNLDILIVDNRSELDETSKYIRSLSRIKNLRVLDFDHPYNYSALNNWAVRQTDASVIVFLNNDTAVISPDWLQEMVSYVLRPEVGAVGAKLYYPDDTIQHAGIVVGLGGLAGHPHAGLPRGAPGYFGRAVTPQQFSAVTAACMAMRRDVFLEIGGFDETEFAIAFSDVDLGLRLTRAGYRVIWTPHAELYHHESATMGPPEKPDRRAQFRRECSALRSRWAGAIRDDPFYNPNLTITAGDFSLAAVPRVRRPWASRPE